MRLSEIEAWALANRFDGIAVVTPTHGLWLGACADAPRTGSTLSAMGKRERGAWAALVAGQVVAEWQKGGKTTEIVLLCGLMGYQELVDELRKLDGVREVLVPLGGASMVRPRAARERQAA